MIFFTVLFTLPGKKATENLYVSMFLMLLKTLLKTGTLTTNDTFYVMTDAATAELLPPNVKALVLPQPTTLLEGISWRYKFFDYVEPDEGSTYLYIDTDHLAIKETRLSISPDTIAVYPEGKPDDTNYCGTLGWKLSHPGLAAGFWAIRPGPKTLRTLKLVSRIIEQHKDAGFYTVEQPMWNMGITDHTPLVYFDPRFISFNGHGDNKLAHFINLAGEPGDGFFHYNKMFRMFLMLFP